MSFRTYRAIDIAIFITVLAVGELLISYASNAWFKINSLGVSIVFPLLIIISMRWSGWVVIPAALGGALTCIFSQLSGGQSLSVNFVIISEAGSLSVLLSVVWFYFVGKKRTADSWFLSLLFVTTMYIINCIAKSTATAIIEVQPFFGCVISYFTRESVTLLFAALVTLIVRRLDGVFEDQKAYLIRLEKQREAEKIKNNGAEQ